MQSVFPADLSFSYHILHIEVITIYKICFISVRTGWMGALLRPMPHRPMRAGIAAQGSSLFRQLRFPSGNWGFLSSTCCPRRRADASVSERKKPVQAVSPLRCELVAGSPFRVVSILLLPTFWRHGGKRAGNGSLACRAHRPRGTGLTVGGFRRIPIIHRKSHTDRRRTRFRGERKAFPSRNSRAARASGKT